MEDLAKQIAGAGAAGRFVRLLVVLLLLLVVLGVGARIYGFYANMRQNWSAYETELLSGLETDVLPAAIGDLRRVCVAVKPDFDQAVRKDWRVNQEDIMKKLQKETTAFRQNAPKNLKAAMKGELDDLVKRYEAQLAEAFPQLKDEEAKDRVVDSLGEAVAVATEKMVRKHMGATVDLMHRIHYETVMFLPDEKSRERMLKATSDLFKPIEKYALEAEKKKGK